MTHHVVTEDELRQFEANVKKIKQVGGGVDGHASTPGAQGRLVTRRELVPNPAPSPKSPYRSKWEAAYASKLDLEQRAGMIKAYWYEPFSLWLPGKVRFKPDFLIQYPDGLEQRLEIIEVKGWSKNLRDGMTRLKIAAAIYNCFVWRLVYRTKGDGWDGEYM